MRSLLAGVWVHVALRAVVIPLLLVWRAAHVGRDVSAILACVAVDVLIGHSVRRKRDKCDCDNVLHISPLCVGIEWRCRYALFTNVSSTGVMTSRRVVWNWDATTLEISACALGANPLYIEINSAS